MIELLGFVILMFVHAVVSLAVLIKVVDVDMEGSL